MQSDTRKKAELARWRKLTPRQKALERVEGCLLYLDYLKAVGDIK